MCVKATPRGAVNFSVNLGYGRQTWTNLARKTGQKKLVEARALSINLGADKQLRPT